MLQNLYVYRDVASGNTGDVFQCVNDAVMRRSVIPSLASIPPAVARDTIVLRRSPRGERGLKSCICPDLQ